MCDYFVVTSGNSVTQVKAIADSIQRRLKERKIRAWHVEGEREALWILLDYGDVVTHVFYDETRRYYNLEHLWGDVPQRRYRVSLRRRAVRGNRDKRKRSKAG